ncbi:hypothetical protein HF577_31830, partial [Pseudonocardia xinjiangensis]|nr:hypothetical protein [Pseudonocardia xinjiangensis]
MSSAELVHNVSADAPGGVVHGLLTSRIGQPQPLDVPMPPLPVASRPSEPLPPESPPGADAVPVVRVQRASAPGRMTTAVPTWPARQLQAVAP